MDNPATDTNPLLTTKFHGPPLRLHLVSRPRLIERIRKSSLYPLTLISAPAGFGKTTLLSAWHDEAIHHAVPVAWVSLDKGDNDETRFWAYLIASLETSSSAIGTPLIEALHAPNPPSIEHILTTLINTIRSTPLHITLVLDDYHLIETPSIHASLIYLLDHLPSNLHLILASRTEPPLPLARLRVRGLLNELHADDLRFTPAEAALFLHQMTSQELSETAINVLETRTEGWIAGLQLAALSLIGSTDIEQTITHFTGSQRTVADYLFTEVLQQQTTTMQDFLVLTSVLDRLSSSLCNAITGRSDCQTILESLEQANLFLVPLDEQRHWYRYHQLFSDFLRHRLHAIHPEQVPILYSRASEWYHKHNLLPEAIECALTAQDFAGAARLIEQVSTSLLQRRELTTLTRWVKALPATTLHERPRLYMTYTTVLATTGQMQAALQCLAHLAQLLQAEDALTALSLTPRQRSDLALEVATMQQLLAPVDDHKQNNEHNAHPSADDGAQDSPGLRSMAAFSKGMAKGLSGDMEGAKQALREAAKLALADNNTYLALTIACQLGTILWSEGKLHEAYLTFQRALQQSKQSLDPLLDLGLAHIGLSSILLDWNELDAAAEHISQSLEQSQQSGNAAVTLFSCTALAQIQQAQGHLDTIPSLIQRAEDILHAYQFPSLILASVKGNLASLALANGNMEQAATCLEEYHLSANDVPQPAHIAAYLALARLSIAQRKYDEALSLLSRLQQVAEEQRLIGNQMRILVAQTLALEAQERTSQALATLAHALSLGEPEGFMRVFLEDGLPMFALLTKLYKVKLKHRQSFPHAFSLAYVSKLLAAFPANVREAASSTSEEQSQPPPQPLVDPLSERELEVLRLIAAGKSNTEIAQRLVIEMSTLKTHIHHLYRKLNVHSRTQAIVRGKQLQLIST